MNDIRGDIRAFAAFVVECNKWSKADQYFVYLEKYEASWRPASVQVRELMKHAANVGHAASVSYYLSECKRRLKSVTGGDPIVQHPMGV